MNEHVRGRGDCQHSVHAPPIAQASPEPSIGAHARKVEQQLSQSEPKATWGNDGQGGKVRTVDRPADCQQCCSDCDSAGQGPQDETCQRTAHAAGHQVGVAVSRHSSQIHTRGPAMTTSTNSKWAANSRASSSSSNLQDLRPPRRVFQGGFQNRRGLSQFCERAPSAGWSRSEMGLSPSPRPF